MDQNGVKHGWTCPHCKKIDKCLIIQGTVPELDSSDLLCRCLICEKLFIRRYKLAQTLKLHETKSTKKT